MARGGFLDGYSSAQGFTCKRGCMHVPDGSSKGNTIPYMYPYHGGCFVTRDFAVDVNV